MSDDIREVKSAYDVDPLWDLVRQVPGLRQFHRRVRQTAQVIAESIVPELTQNYYHSSGFLGSFETPAERERHERTLEIVASHSTQWGDALEVGCAEGVFTSLLASRCRSVHGVDISGVACQRAAVRCSSYPNVRIARLDIVIEPIDRLYDLVFVMDLLEYVRGAKRRSSIATKFAAVVRCT